MAVMAYNDWLRSLLTNVECVLAFDTAADFQGLTNGGYRSVAQIFVNKKQKIEGTEQIITESLANYYEEHDESFDGLQIPQHLQSRYEKYKVWALEYYEGAEGTNSDMSSCASDIFQI